MPKLKHKNPKLGQNGNYAVVRYKGKTHRLGQHGTKESLIAYNRFCAELQTNPAFLVPKNERDITLDEVAAAYLDYANRRFGKTEYGHYRTALAFAIEIYGDQPVDTFSYQNLRTVRNEIIRSGRFCRDMINKYVGRIRTAFSWGVENGIVEPGTLAKLRILRPLEKGEPDTFDHDEREDVPIEVVTITLRYTSPTVSANKAGENIPHWTPYQLRHTAGTETSRTLGRDKAQVLLTHKSSAMTARYDHSQVAVLKELARNRVNPFAKTDG